MNTRSTARRKLYPHSDPKRAGRLRMTPLHEIYWEEAGYDRGIPALSLHGGPGGGASAEMRRFFDPRAYRTILYDQRGCGRSTPHSELEGNDTWALVEDIEKLRKYFGFEKWLVFGGSWGSTLALAYAVTYPERVSGLILRGIFLLTQAEIKWFYQEGANRLFPDAFEKYQSVIPENERHDMVAAFYRRLTSDNPVVRQDAAMAWANWEGETLSIRGPDVKPPRFEEGDFVDAFARIECHFFINGGFFEEDGWLLKQAHRLKGIPISIVHGRYDVVTPMSSAWALKKAAPHADLSIIPDAGHSSLEPGIVDALIKATDRMARQLKSG